MIELSGRQNINENNMNVVSFFDGCGTGKLVLNELGIDCNYYAYEIDKDAIKVCQANHPDVIQCEDVKTFDFNGKIDLFLAGFPCNDLSIAKTNRKGLRGAKSSLFWDTLSAIKKSNPTHFLIENNASMPKIDRDIITSCLGVEPVEINSSLISGQNRRRLYWTNLSISPLEDKGITISDVVGIPCKGAAIRNQKTKDGLKTMINVRKDSKSNCVVASYSKKLNGYFLDGEFHSLTCEHLEKLQTLPIGYTDYVSDSARRKMIGMGWTKNVIKHILKEL